MKYFNPLLTLLIVPALCVMAQQKDVEERGVRSRTFNVATGGTIDISVNFGDIRITPWSKNEVHVQVDGLDDRDLDRVKMTQTGNNVKVTFRPRWDDDYGNVQFDISVPASYNIDMSTSGGDLQLTGALTGSISGSTSGGDIKLGTVHKGPVDVSTSGGDIEAKEIRGDGKLKTSGGDIRIGNAAGELEVSTSGGDIRLETIGKSLVARTSGGDITVGDVGGEARVSTAGGDIKVGKVSGKAALSTAGGDIELQGATGSVTAKTAGGDVRLSHVTGTVEARTAGGEVEAEINPTGKGSSRLVSAGGDVTLHIPVNAKATIEAVIQVRERWGRSGNRYKVRSDFKADSYESDDEESEIRAVYKLNGGGEVISLETVNADIHIRKSR